MKTIVQSGEPQPLTDERAVATDAIRAGSKDKDLGEPTRTTNKQVSEPPQITTDTKTDKQPKQTITEHRSNKPTERTEQTQGGRGVRPVRQ